MKMFAKYAALAATAGVLALAAATPSQARWHGHWHGAGAGAAIGFAAGAAVGAAAANSAYYDDGYYGYGPDYGYAYAPDDSYAYDGPVYRYGPRSFNSGCSQSPGSVHYVPCDSR